MLFKNLVGAIVTPDLLKFRTVRNEGLRHVVIQMDNNQYSTEELNELLDFGNCSAIAVRIHKSMSLGKKKDLTPLHNLITLTAKLIPQNPKVILTSDTLALGEIFEYLDQHPSEFRALQTLKSEWVYQIIEQIKEIQKTSDPLGVEILIENAPIGGKEYFEPGHSLIHPALRTHRNLLSIVQATGIKIAFNTAHARTTTNILSYFHRSRSLFAAATEDEILSAPSDWVEFYQEIREHVELVLLSDCISWADTDETNYLPFREETFPELLSFADEVDEKVPIILFTGHKNGNNQELTRMKEILHQLKRI
jgi:hypothetical protein